MQDEEFEISDITGSFDFKGFIFKIFSYWWLFIISIGIGLSIAYYISVRKLPIYELTSLVSVKEKTNPLFTTNTSLTFQWGGASNKVNQTIIVLGTRTHNEKVVKQLEFYIDYLEEGEYQRIDAYGNTPFKVQQDPNSYQIHNRLIHVVPISDHHFELKFKLSEAELEKDSINVNFYNYMTEDQISQKLPAIEFSKTFRYGEKINTFFFNGSLERTDVQGKINEPYYFKFSDLYGKVGSYRNLKVDVEKGSSVLKLSLRGGNKNRIVDYLNGTIQALQDDMLDSKNLYATNTIKFIDSLLVDRSDELNKVQQELDNFKEDNQIFDLDAESSYLRTRLTSLDTEEREINKQINYYNILEDYLKNRNDYSELPAPTVFGITEASISTSVGKIVELAEQRSRYSYTLQEGAIDLEKIDREIDASKNVLLENLASTKRTLEREVNYVQNEIKNIEKDVRKLPKEQQELLKIERRFELSQETYNQFLIKRNEAKLIKAANVSDVEILDAAKDIGAGKIGPNNQLNYVMAVIIGGGIPFLFVFLLAILDNKVNNPKDIENKSEIPIIGVIGKSKMPGNLAVFKKSRGAIAESFRGMRTSLQFTFKKKDLKSPKVILCTSTVSGEGKTFTSINLASVLSLSNKKTILVGLDLRKPKIFDDFDIQNKIGVVNYLIGHNSLEDVTQASGYDNLDIITSGPIPPNPSELLMDEKMDDLIAELKKKYDYIILDTPPIGLVSDALNLIKYVDASLYLIRQNYTKRAMINVINEKYRTGEVKNISFVMNYFEQKAKYGYGYGHGYGYGYGYGYGKYGESYLDVTKKGNILKRIFNKIFRRK